MYLGPSVNATVLDDPLQGFANAVLWFSEFLATQYGDTEAPYCAAAQQLFLQTYCTPT